MPATSIEAQKEVELYTNRQGYIMFRLEEVGSILPKWMDERERFAQSKVGRHVRRTWDRALAMHPSWLSLHRRRRGPGRRLQARCIIGGVNASVGAHDVAKCKVHATGSKISSPPALGRDAPASSARKKCILKIIDAKSPRGSCGECDTQCETQRTHLKNSARSL